MPGTDGFPGGYRLLSKGEHEDWKKTVKWEWDIDDQGRALDATGQSLSPSLQSNPGHPNILSYIERPVETESQLCRIIRKRGRPPVPRLLAADELPNPRELSKSNDPDRPGTLIISCTEVKG